MRADNWLDALREGRRQLGETGGVPPGASCAFGATGAVTLLDPTQRRRYVLTPANDDDRAPSPPDEAPTARSVSGHPSSEPGGMSAGERALAVSPTQPAPAPESRPEANGLAPGAGRAKQTRDFSPERAEALRREYELARARSSVPPASPREVPSDEVWPRQSARPGGEPTRDASPGTRTDPNHAAPHDVRSASLPPPAPALRANAARTSGELPKQRAVAGSVYGLRGDGLALLTARDLEPTASSPLTYRERAYLLAGKADSVRLEVLLQAELACIRRELAGHPRGQFVRLGVFTEAFEGTPDRPPYATLEWKDWRGRAVFQLLGEAESRPAAAPPGTAGAAPEQASMAHTQPSMTPSQIAPPFASAPAEAHATVAPRPDLRAPAGEVPHASALPASPLAAPQDEERPAAASESGSDGQGELSEEGRSSEPDLRLATAFESMPDLHLLPTPLTGLEFAVELLARLIPCEAISGCLYDAETDEFRFVALRGVGGAERKASAIRASAGLFGAARRGDALLIANVREERRYDPAVDGRPMLATRSLAYAAVRHQGQLLGMLQLINGPSAEGFAQSDVPVLTYVAAQLGEFLANCRALTV